MQPDEAITLICQLFEESCIELFESMQCQTERIAEHDLLGADAPIAFIDAGSDDFEVLLTLRLPFPALTMTYPVQEQILNIDEKELEDWILEMANRLLGLLKVKLTARHCMVKTGLPSHDFGFDTSHTINHQPYYAYHFNIDEELVETGIRIEPLADDISLTADFIPPENNIQAGELDFF